MPEDITKIIMSTIYACQECIFDVCWKCLEKKQQIFYFFQKKDNIFVIS